MYEVCYRYNPYATNTISGDKQPNPNIHYFYPIYRVSQKNETQVLLYISAIKYRSFKSFFSPENWDQYVNFEYKSISVQLVGTEIFAKQNGILD